MQTWHEGRRMHMISVHTRFYDYLLDASKIRHAPQFMRTVKDPISICRKIVLTAGGMETRKHCTQKKTKTG